MLDKTAAVILAAGAGTRMCSDLPKVLHRILDRPLVNFPVRLSQELGLQSVVVVVGVGREAVQEAVLGVAPDAAFAHQEEQNGTGHAVLTAEAATRGAEHVLVLYGDVPGLRPETVKRMVAARADAPFSALFFDVEDPTGYGRAVRDERGRLLKIVEHRDCTEAERAIPTSNAGVYLIGRDFLYDALAEIGSSNDQGEYYLTDIAEVASAAGTPGVVVLVDHQEVAGINDRAQLAEASAVLQRRRNQSLMCSGVTMEAPERTRIGFDARVEPDVVLGSDVTLLGATTVGRGTTIMQGCVLRDARVGESALLKPYCVIEASTLGNEATVGPFAHLRPGTVLGLRSKIGNFVETKKAVLGEGSKASHLTYLGDCELGRDVNIGAGTITCNYDGLDKHRTEIGDRVFVGSNVEIVAPASIGEEALIGAGTTVTKPVPAGALAISRAPQKNIEGWSDRAGPWARRRARTKKKGT